jgi:hypothetical protein
MAQELTAGRLRALILDPGEALEEDVMAAMAKQELCALVFRQAIGDSDVHQALVALEHPELPRKIVDGGMVCGGLPLRLATGTFDAYVQTARQFRALAGPPEGPGLESSLVSLLDGAIRTHHVTPLRDEAGNLFAPGCLVQMNEGQGIPVHMDQMFFHMPSIYPDVVDRLGLDNILNTVVCLAVPEAGGVIEMYDVRWSDLPGEDPLQEALALGNDGVPADAPRIPLPLEVGNVMVLDAMLTGHIVMPVRGNRRRVTYTGHLGLRGKEAFCFV